VPGRARGRTLAGWEQRRRANSASRGRRMLWSLPSCHTPRGPPASMHIFGHLARATALNGVRGPRHASRSVVASPQPRPIVAVWP